VISFNRFLYQSSVRIIRALALPFHLAAVRVPQNEGQKILAAAAKNEVVIVYNGGGWGDYPLEKARDFAPILEAIQEILHQLGYRTTTVAYHRTLPGLAGRMAGIKEQLNSFPHTAEVQRRDIEEACRQYPGAKFLLIGFSLGGGLSARTLRSLNGRTGVLGITVGVPGWFETYQSEKSLVLNNRSRDPLTTGDFRCIAINVIKSPWVWLRARMTGRPISYALAFQFPYHEYPWASPFVGPPIARFLASQLKRRK
jgi:hypothetical protein